MHRHTYFIFGVGDDEPSAAEYVAQKINFFGKRNFFGRNSIFGKQPRNKETNSVIDFSNCLKEPHFDVFSPPLTFFGRAHCLALSNRRRGLGCTSCGYTQLHTSDRGVASAGRGL